jgi:23S rRNA (uracil1939-C5)-methyltransferase
MRRATLRTGEIPQTMVECPHASTCAGCPLIHLDYAAQLAAKRTYVVNAATHYPALELLYTRPVEPADPFTRYRTRAKLIVAAGGGIGLYAKSSNHEVVDIPSCRVLSPALAEVASALRGLVVAPPDAARALLMPYDSALGGVLRAVDLREVRDGGGKPSVLATFVVQRDRAPSRDELIIAGRALLPLLPFTVGVAANLHDAESPQILGPETILLAGVGVVEDTIGGTHHLASFGSFVQAHREQAARIHNIITEEVRALEAQAGGAKVRVLDLYGGSGAISLAVARAGAKVTLVESFSSAAANARAAAQAQGFDIDVRPGDVAEVAAASAASGERFDVVIVNPPRRGVSPAAREAIARIAAPLLVYVSCDPDTLARDLDHWARLGYAAGELAPFDMIPLTEEVETVCLLRRAPAARPLIIYEDEDVIVVEKGAHEPVEPQPEYASSLLARCTRLPRGDVLLPVHRIDPNTSGLCMLARTEEARALWTTALEQGGRVIYLCAAKGVTPAKGAITRDLREGGRVLPARTRYRRLAIASGHSVLRVIPDDGRAHQIRRHLAAIGHPVLGDERYGHMPTNRYFEEKHGLDRTFLHLVRIEIQHPRTGAKLLIESTLPGDLRSAIERATGSSVLRFLEQKHALGDHRASSIPPPPAAGDDQADGPPPSSRVSTLPDEMGDSMRPSLLPITDEGRAAPDLDESPRSIRPAIVSDDDA